MIREPIVLMIRQPPVYVPIAIAVADDTTTHVGTWKFACEMSPCAISASVITPIVFCASLVPCARASRPPEKIWPSLKPPLTGPGRSRPTSRYTSRIAIPATVKASIGAITAGTTTLPSSPLPSIADAPSAMNAAPTTPPISACDELDGNPKYQVSRFHMIAPIRPAKTIVIVIEPELTMPLAIVAATACEMNAPTKLRIAAMATAVRGGSARVEIDVATTLAVSWKPFVKSNASAAPTTMTRIRSLCTSGVLDHDALEDVGDRLGRVDRALEALVDVLPSDHDHRVDAALEQRGCGLARDAVAVVLEPVDLDRVVRHVAEVAQLRHRLGDLARGLVEHVGELLRLLERRLDLVEAEVVGDLLRVVDDVVERGGERVYVLAVDRRDEQLVEAADDVVCDPVALLLADKDVAREVGVLGVAAQHLVEQVGCAQDVARRLLEQVEELAVSRHD